MHAWSRFLRIPAYSDVLTKPHINGFNGYKVSDCEVCISFLTEKNYFGNLLGNSLPAVMEVMYHGSLKAGHFREDWHTTFQDMYQFVNEGTLFKANNSKKLLLHTSDYKSTTHTPYHLNVELIDTNPDDDIGYRP